MASLWLNGTSWVLRPKGGKPQTLGPISEDEARRFLERQERRERRDPTGARKPPGFATLEAVIGEWLEDCRGRLRPKTIRRYEVHVEAFKAGGLDLDKRIGLVTSADIQAFRDARVEAGCSNVTVNHDLTALGQIWSWARKRVPPHVEHDVDPVASVGRLDDDSSEPGACTPELHAAVTRALRAEVEFCDRADQAWMRALVADVIDVCWWTGWRLGEATRLLVEDIDQKAWTLPIRSARNKGRAIAWPLPAKVVPIFKARVAGREPTDHVFGLEDGRDAYGAINTFRTRWLAIPANDKHRPAFFHSLRHGYTTGLEKVEGRASVRQGLTRHRSPSMLLHYSHASLDELRAAQEALARSRRAALRSSSRAPRARPQKP